MENRKWDALRGSIGFYTTLVVCLLVVGVSGYFLLFDNEDPQEPLPGKASSQTTVTAPAPEIVPETEVPPIVETISPTPTEVEVPPMPEIEIDDTPVIAVAPRLVVSPLKGEVLTAFSVDELLYNETLEDWRTHDGIDIAAKPGTTVMAACSGTVSAVLDDALMGTTVVIDHSGGYQTTYANLQARPNVDTGDEVSPGQIIGAVGTTAAAESAQSPHLHFSVTKDGYAIDPDEFLNQ